MLSSAGVSKRFNALVTKLVILLFLVVAVGAYVISDLSFSSYLSYSQRFFMIFFYFFFFSYLIS